MNSLVETVNWILHRYFALGATTEIRVLRPMPQGKPVTFSGYFGPDDVETLAAMIEALPEGPRQDLPRTQQPRSGEAAFYFSLQGVDPKAIRGSRGTLELAAKTSRDQDILVYSLMVIDVDPVRPSGVSATDVEKRAALGVTQNVRAWLETRGIPSIQADSGNGYHLLVPLVPYQGARVREAATSAKSLLKLLDAEFSTPEAKVDTSTFNPGRILKLYGTVACKGENTPERPHRLATIDLSNVPQDVDLFAVLKPELEAAVSPPPKLTPAPSRAKPIMPGISARNRDDNSGWKGWREEALKLLPLERVYGDLLTGHSNAQGWLACRDPDSPTGDQNPSAGVADKVEYVDRGAFHSFRTGETMSVFDFLIRRGRAADFKAAQILVADLSGVPLPASMARAQSSRPVKPGERHLSLESLEEAWQRAPDHQKRDALVVDFLSRLTDVPILEQDRLLEALSEVTGIRKNTLNKQLRELKPARNLDRQPPSDTKPERVFIEYVFNQDPIADLFDRVLQTIRPVDRFFRTEEDLVFIRLGKGLIPIKDTNFPGFLSGYAEIRLREATDEGIKFKKFSLLPPDLARAFTHDPRVRSKLPPLALYCRSPLFCADWSFIGNPGYHCGGGGVFYDGKGVTPRNSDLRYLLSALEGFCWKSPIDCMNFIGALLTAITMPHWGRGHPFLAINGNKPGIGKSTLASVLAVIVEGHDPGSISYIPDDTEFEKQLATRVEGGDRVIVIDNAKTRRPIESQVLERNITASRINFRRLGTNTAITRPQNDVLFCLTMNMTQLGPDLRRRALPINLLKEENVRTSHYPLHDVIAYALEHRLEIIAELSGMVQVWLDQGRRLDTAVAQHSVSQRWAQTIDAILRGNGLNGFLSNFDESMHAFDEDYVRIMEICRFHNAQSPRTASEWADLLKDDVMEGRFKDRRGNLKSAQSRATIMGSLFASYLESPFNLEGVRYRIVRDYPRGETHSPTFHFIREPE